MSTRILLTAALASYAGAWLLQVADFRGGGAARRPPSGVLAIGAVCLHFAALLAFWFTYGTPPLSGFGPASAFLAFALATGFLLASRSRERWSAGLLVLPMVIALLAASLVAGLAPTLADPRLQGPWLVAHVLLVFGGCASLLLASVAASMYLFQFRALKRKDFGNVFRFFPSLESLDRMNRIGLAGGLSALAIGLLAGWSLSLTFGRGLALGDSDVAFGLLTWVVYAAALGARRGTRGFGLRPARVSVAACVASGVGFVALRVLGPATEFFL
ncbi:cytochrome c biogenesis protein CcsA [Candidatus Palauibacter sp.]|uniref:cytochrome c biogenesis protein CcsA n=1 Tax=Candidatus Palauibacter sp. TaxID=3101350 RepID=UPI003B02E40B